MNDKNLKSINCQGCQKKSYLWNACEHCEADICSPCWTIAERKQQDEELDIIPCPKCEK